MTATRPLSVLAAQRAWVYGGGLLAIVGVRFAPVSVPRPVSIGVVSLVLAVMVLTYAGEQVGDDTATPNPGLLVVGVAGIAGGTGLMLSGTPAGLAFLAGGLLFLRRGLRTGERP